MPSTLHDLSEGIQPYLTRENAWMALAVLGLIQLIWIKFHLSAIRRHLTNARPPLRIRLWTLATSQFRRASQPQFRSPGGARMRGSSGLGREARQLAQSSPRFARTSDAIQSGG